MDKNENPAPQNQSENLDKGFTVKEVASFLDETPNVIRNWFKELRDYIPHEKDSNGYNLYKKEGIERFKEIKKLHREQGWSMKQIESYLVTGGEFVKPEPEKTTGELLAEELRLMREELKALRLDNQEIKDQLEQQKGFNQALIEQLKQSDRASLERHNHLTASLKESMEERKLIAAAIENQDKNLDKQKKGLFARLLGR